MAHFRVLGPPEACSGGETIALSGRQRTLLAVLLASRGTTVSVDRLVDALWRDAPPPTAVASLHSHVSRLRTALRSAAAPGDGSSTLCTRAGGYCLRTGDDAVDADVFEHLVECADARLATSPAEAAALLDRALALWGGAAFAGYEHEDFARPEAVRLEERRLWALEQRAAALLACGRESAAVPVLEQVVAEHPLRERPRGQLMVALYRTGRHAEALGGYQDYRSTLVEQLGLDPSPELQQIERDILRHSGELGRTSPTAPRTADGRRLPRSRPDSFVGRAAEAADLQRLLGSARLVTVVGPGGVGKTRLAEHVARELAAGDPSGVLSCDLSSADAGAVVPALASAVGARAVADRSLGDVLVESLSATTLLLLVDNCEHVVAEAAAVLGRIVAEAPSVRVLATSREPLAVPGEHVYRLAPLRTERGAGDDGPPPAVELFLDRAAAATGGRSAPVAPEVALDLCRALDGLPLAIELAASRAAVMHPSDLRRHLDERLHLLAAGAGREQRHRTLHAVVEWSYDLLTGPEARLFDRLSVFAGGFGIDAAVEVCADDPVDRRDVAGLLAQLADRSLVVLDGRAAPTRYRLLETLRQYGAEQLGAAGEVDRWRRRHLHWCVALAERAAAGMATPDCGTWVRTVGTALADLRAAHAWAVADGDLDAGFRLVAALERYAFQQLHDEVFTWAERLLELPGADEHPSSPAVAGIAAVGAGVRGDFTGAAHLARRGLAAAADPDDPRRILPLAAMAELSLYEGRLEDQLAFAGAMTELARRAGEVFHESLAVLHHALGCTYLGDRRRALGHVRRLYELAEPLPGSSLRAWALYAHGEAVLADDPAAARSLLLASIDEARAAEDRFAEGVALVSATSVAVRSGPAVEALRALDTAVRHWQERGDLTHQRVTIRLLVELLDRLGRGEAATVLLAATTSGAMAPPSFDEDDAVRTRRLAEAVREQVGEERFRRAWEKGAGLDPHDVASAALAEVEAALASR